MSNILGSAPGAWNAPGLSGEWAPVWVFNSKRDSHFFLLEIQCDIIKLIHIENAVKNYKMVEKMVEYPYVVTMSTWNCL